MNPFAYAVGDRPGVHKIRLDGKKKPKGRAQLPRNMTQPGAQPEATPSGLSPIEGGVQPSAIAGPRPSSAVAPTTQGQSPTQQFTTRQNGSVWQQKPAALQGRQLQYYVVPRTPRVPSQVASAAKPLAIAASKAYKV